MNCVLFPPSKPRLRFPEASEAELARQNWNPYQHRLLTLFSQSSETNRGTRGLDDFDRWAYVATRVDRELYADIREGRFQLVVITGNAGDGKTAFIQTLQQRILEDGGGVVVELPHETARSSNTKGAGWSRISTAPRTRANDRMTRSWRRSSRPLPCTLPASDRTETRVIAINEGRLIDFVSDQRDRFPALEASVMGFVDRGER